MSLSAPAPLAQQHRLAGFDCGQPALNDWLLRRALPNQQRGATRTFVVCDGEAVVAYYALASGAVAITEATGRLRRNIGFEESPLAPMTLMITLADLRAALGIETA